MHCKRLFGPSPMYILDCMLLGSRILPFLDFPPQHPVCYLPTITDHFPISSEIANSSHNHRIIILAYSLLNLNCLYSQHCITHTLPVQSQEVLNV